MKKITFKINRKMSTSGSGYRSISKTGDLQFDGDRDSDDVVHINTEDVIGSSRIIIDVNKDGTVNIKF